MTLEEIEKLKNEMLGLLSKMSDAELQADVDEFNKRRKEGKKEMFENHCIYDKETICAVEDKNPATCSERGCVAQKIYVSGYMTCMNELVGQRRFGTWRKVCEVPSGQLYRCSRCGRDIVTTLTDKEAILQEYPYCHCGVKMVGASDG